MEICDSLSDRVYQPTLHPLRSNVGTFFFHGYDRDLSFAVRETRRRCVVVNAPFVHRGGGTRTGAGAPVRSQEDLGQRQAALARFAGKWARRLPADVRRARERVADWLTARARR